MGEAFAAPPTACPGTPVADSFHVARPWSRILVAPEVPRLPILPSTFPGNEVFPCRTLA